MGTFDKLFGTQSSGDMQEPLPVYPWDQRPSIYEHVHSHIAQGQLGLTAGGEELPDEKRLAAESQLRWAPGALDGVMTHHMGGGTQDQVDEALCLLRTYWQTPTATNKANIYEFVVENNVVGLIDPLAEQLSQETDINHARLYDLARSLATESPDRGPVKFGIALLGGFGQHEDLEIFRTLGRHDEFTLFCAVALGNASEDAESELWELAKNVNGWGRIHVVERLAETQNPEIKAWLLREGYKNGVMHEYLAYTCATTGGLLAALSEDEVDGNLLISASEILQALIYGGPAEDINCYDDAAIVVELYLGHVERRVAVLRHLLAVATIQGFLSDDEADWGQRADRGWTSERRASLLQRCEEFIRDPEWPSRVAEGLRSNDDWRFHEADRAAHVLKLDVWTVHWDRLRQSPLDPGRWYPVVQACTDERVDTVLNFAERHLPLAEIATGPANELGLGLEWQPHSCLDFLVQELGRFPGRGIRLIETAIRSPVTRNRNMALRAISGWDRNMWTKNMEPLLRQALQEEPDEDVRTRIAKVIAGEPIDE